MLWDPTEIMLDSMVQKAQQFEYARQSSKSKNSLRTARQDGETNKFKSEKADLRRQCQGLQKSKPRKPDTKSKLQCGTVVVEGISPKTILRKRMGMIFLTASLDQTSQALLSH